MPENPTDAAGKILVVAVALIGPDGRICMQQRQFGKNHGGLWEFPGGKVEQGEAPRAALAREISEELGLRLDPEALVPVGFAESGTLVILLYAVRAWQGEARCLEAAAIGWFAPEEIAALAMPPLDYPLAERLCQLLRGGAI